MCVDDHPLMREGVAALVERQSDMLLVGEAANGADAVLKYRECRPDVVLMDLRLPDGSGIDALAAIRSEFPDARVVMLTTFAGDVEIHRALRAGARGYLLKSMPPQELVRGIRDVHAGLKRIPAEVAAQLAEHVGSESLTARELEVLREASSGNRNRDIAERLCITEETVKVHMKNLMQKLDARDRTEAISIAIRRGILHLQ
jgi:DNA-binding NarL/FixJ family response regulator